MSDCFLHGILSQGETFTDRETHRLFAKKCWLGLIEYLLYNDEIIKAQGMFRVIPWSLDEDRDVQRFWHEVEAQLDRFTNTDALFASIDAVQSIEASGVDVKVEAKKGVSPRGAWVVQRTLADNPKTVLDVGVGWGHIAYQIAHKGPQVTALCPVMGHRDALQEMAEEEGLPIQLLPDLIEDFDPGDTRFDVVILGEILEHVANDRAVLEKCVSMANSLVIVTTPVGSVEGGFRPMGIHDNEHVRAYSLNSFKRLIEDLPGVKDVEVTKEVNHHGYLNQPIECFCAKIIIDKETKYHVDTQAAGYGREGSLIPVPGEGNQEGDDAP